MTAHPSLAPFGLDPFTRQKQKTELRRRVLAVRQAFQPPAGWEDKLVAIGAAHLAAVPPGIVAGYAAVRGEVDPMPLMRRLSAQGWQLALPRITGYEQRTMTFRHWQPGEALIPNRYGIAEPDAAAQPAEPDVVLTPLVAYDPHGGRLGYGGGYYDRALAVLRAAKPHCRLLGVAYGFQQVADVFADVHDIRLDGCIAL